MGRQKIRDLLQLFGCVYAEGRADKAPKMRKDIGTSKGEMLMVDVQNFRDVVTWQCKSFPAGRSIDGHDALPDAFHSIAGYLPHLHADCEDRYPQAVAAEDLPDYDPPMDNTLEVRGALLGQSKERFRAS